MGHWGVRSDQVDEAADALDAAFESVHGRLHEDLMDDRNPATVEEIHRRLANTETLAAAVAALGEDFGADLEGWDEVARLAFAGVVVHHAELGVPIPDDWRRRAIDWLEHEEIDWDEATARRLRRQEEIALLSRALFSTAPTPSFPRSGLSHSRREQWCTKLTVRSRLRGPIPRCKPA